VSVAGAVADSRGYTPLADASPTQSSDGAAAGMQHMGVVKDVILPGE
jgi:hypothetical protein